jgi:sugar/nucleoside kinase (ribokinase family)
MLEAARQLAQYGPREIIITQSSGAIAYVEGEFYEAPFLSRTLQGRTGRGDTCFATYLGKRLHAEPREACRFAAAVTSLKQERPGPWNGDREAVERLLSRFDDQ